MKNLLIATFFVASTACTHTPETESDPVELADAPEASEAQAEPVVSEASPPSKPSFVYKAFYAGEDSCFVACYSHDEKNSAYKLSDSNTYVMGMYRLQGRYEGDICRPKGNETADISAKDEFKQYCQKAFPNACRANPLSCWSGGDTGGFMKVKYTGEKAH